MSFTIDDDLQNQSMGVDVLLDITQTAAEDNEDNNHFDQYMKIPDCSFNCANAGAARSRAARRDDAIR